MQPPGELAMKITNEMRKAINSEVRALCGTSPLAEVGLRCNSAGDWVPNGLNWAPGSDLGDLCRLAYLKEIDDCPDLPGAATLDLYVTSGTGMHRELETNVYVTIKNGKVVDVHTDDLANRERGRAILGRDPYADEAGEPE